MVTGAGSFVGRSLVPQLEAAGYEVHAVSRTAHSGGHVADLLTDPTSLVASIRPQRS